MLDWPSRALLAVTSAVLAFTLTGVVLDLPAGDVATPVSTAPSLPDFALQTARPVNPPTATEDPAEANPAPPVTVAFGGDVHGEAPISAVLEQGSNPLDAVADVLGAADVAIVNLETAVGSGGTPADKTYTFQADPLLVERLADAGVDVVSLANNHALDFGTEAAAETRELAEAAGLAVVGHGEDRLEAYAPHVVDIDGRRVAVIGLSRVFPVIEWAATDNRPGLASAYPVHLAGALQAVRDAAAVADHVVVMIHWGRERWTCPDGDQVALAEALAAAGADVIAGHHPHVLQGIEQFGESLVAYSIGNLSFYARTPATRQSGILTVTLGQDGALDHTWSPAQIDGQGQPQPVPTQAPLPEGDGLITTSSSPRCGPPS